MKQIELIKLIEVKNVNKIIISSVCNWAFLIVHYDDFRSCAIHNARNDIKTFSTIDSAERFIRKCGWSEEIVLMKE